jgi:anti-sigma regulatory factor (Ser/Thr protein kinase)
MQQLTTGTREWARTFSGTPRQVAYARHAVAGILAGCPRADDAVLVVSELATNAVLHAASAFSVSLSLSGRGIRISVGDTLPLGPTGVDQQLAAVSGHGLGVVAAMATRWGVENVPTGKAVWAELPLPG